MAWDADDFPLKIDDVFVGVDNTPSLRETNVSSAMNWQHSSCLATSMKLRGF